MKLFAFLLSSLLAADCLPIDTPVIRAEDLAAVIPAFLNAAGQTAAPAPMAGAERRFSRRDLMRLAKRFGLAEPPGETLPDTICFSFPLSVLTAERILPAIREAGGDAVEIVSHSTFAVPAGRVRFEKLGSRSNQRDGSQLLRGSVQYAPGRKQPIWVRVRRLDSLRGLVATRHLRAGELVASPDFAMAELSSAVGPPVVSMAEVDGRVLRRAVAAGTPLTVAMLTRRRDIDPGDTARVTVRAGAALLSFESRAETGGFTGDSVLLSSPVSGRRFKAKIEGRSRAVLDLATKGGK